MLLAVRFVHCIFRSAHPYSPPRPTVLLSCSWDTAQCAWPTTGNSPSPPLPLLPQHSLFVSTRCLSFQHWDKDVCLNFADRCLSFLKDNVDEGPRYSFKFLEPYDHVTLEQIGSQTLGGGAMGGGAPQ